jgi:hypothetical protein
MPDKKPWEKYSSAEKESKPWEKYSEETPVEQQPSAVQPPVKKKSLVSRSPWEGIMSSVVPSVKTEQQPAVSSSVKKAEIPQAVDIAKLNPDIKRDKTKDGLYTFPDQETAVYKKQNGQWFVDVNKSGNFQPLTKGDVEARSKNLDARAIPLGYEERTTYLAKEKDGTKTSLEQEVAKINSFMKDYDWEAKKEAELKARGQVERKLTPSQLRNDPRTPKLTYNNNEYRINRLTDGTESWEKKDKLSGDFFVISDPNSITLLNKKLGGKVPIESPLFEETRKSQLERRQALLPLNQGLIGRSEEQAVPRIKNILANLGVEDDFTVEQIGAGYDAIGITNKVTGDYEKISLDNWSEERDKQESKVLKSFIESYAYNKEYFKKKKQIDELSIANENDFNASDIEGMIKKNEKLNKLKDEVANIEKGRDRFINDNEYRATAEKNVKNEINNYKTKIDILNIQSIDLKEAAKSLSEEKDILSQVISAGTISQEDAQARLESIQKRESNLRKTKENISSELQYLVDRKEFNENVVKDAYLINSERGNILSGTTQAFTRGMEAPFRMILNAYERQTGQKYVGGDKSIFGDDEYGWGAGVSTLDYTKSENRGDFSKAIFGISESLGSALSGYLLTGGAMGIVPKDGASLSEKASNLIDLGIFASMYNSSRDQMEGEDWAGVPLEEKVFLSIAMATPQMILEKFGLTEALRGTNFGRKLTNNILKQVFNEVPKDAASDVVEKSIKNKMVDLIKEGVLRANAAGIVEATTEGSQYLSEVSTQEIYNLAKGKEFFDVPNNFMELVENVGENAKLGYIGGASLGAVASVASIAREKITKDDFSKLENTINDVNLNELLTLEIQKQVVKGKITQEEANQKLENIQKFKKELAIMPKDMPIDDKFEASNLLAERAKIQAEIEGKEKTLVQDKTNRINEINNQLKEIGNRKQAVTENEVTLEDKEINPSKYDSDGNLIKGSVSVEAPVLERPTIQSRNKEAEAKIKRKDLFYGVGDFSTKLGGSDKSAIPISHKEINGIEFVEYAHPETGSVDVIVTGESENDFVGFYRIYENGKPTNKWSSKFENQSRNKANFKTMISGVQEMLPKGHEYTEKTSISTDGLRVWNQQLDKGYEVQRDKDGNVVTDRVAINGDAISNELGIEVSKGNFRNISVTNNNQFETVKKAITPYLEKLGLTSDNIYWENGTVTIDLPVLKQQEGKQEVQKPSEKLAENQKEVEKLRAEEQTELSEAIPNIDDYKVDGEIDKKKIKASEDGAKYQEIYDKYDKLITPLLPKVEEQPTAKTEEVSDENSIDVFHGGSVESIDNATKDSPLFVSEDESQAKTYAKGNKGKVAKFKIDKTKVANEEEIYQAIEDLGLKSKDEEWNVKELNVFELIDPRFDTSLSEEDIVKLYEELEKRGYGAAKFTDTDLDTDRQEIENIVVFNSEIASGKLKEQPTKKPTTLKEDESIDLEKEATLKDIEDAEKELKELEDLLEKIEQKKKEKIKEKTIDESIKESLSNEEIEDAAKEQGVTVDELIKIIKENVFKPIANLGSYIKEKTKKLIKKVRQKLLTIVFGGVMLTSTLGFTYDNNGRLVYNVEQLVDSILPDSQAQQVKRWLDKNNYLENQDIEITNKKESTIKETPQVEKSFEVIGTIPDSYNPSDSLLSYRSQWDNSKGFEYIPAPVKRDLPSGGMKVSGVVGVGHFLLDASAAGKTYSHEYNKKFLERAKQLNHWIPTFTRMKNGRVLLKYKKFNEINQKDIVLSPLRQFNFSDIDFSKTQTPSGFKNSVKEVKTKDGKGTYLLFKSRDGYSRFSGGSVVFIFKDSYGNTIVRDFAGSLNQIENEGINIKKSFNLKDGDLTIGYHDVGSFSAKPKAKEGVIDTEQWEGFNNEGMTGGALLIPIDGNTSSKTPVESGGGLLALLALVKSLKRKLESNEELSDSEILDIKNKIKTLKEEIEKNKQKESEASKAAKNISKKDNTKVTVTERVALKDQLRLEAKAARESAMNIKKKQRALIDSVKAMADSGKITASQSKNLIRRLAYLNVDNVDTTQDFLDYADRLFANAEYSDKVDKAFKAKAKIKAKLKSKNQAPVTQVAKEFATIDPSLVTDIDKYNEMADAMLAAIAPSVSGVKKNEEGEYEANNKLKTPINIADVQSYVEKALEAQKEIEKQRLLSYYKELVEAGIINDKMSIEEIREIVANEKNDEDKLTAKERAKIVMDDLKERFAVAKSAIEDILATDNSISESDREIIKRLMSLDITDMKIKDAMALVDAANNFIENGITAGLRNEVPKHEGDANMKELRGKGFVAKSIGFLRGFGTKKNTLGKTYATQAMSPAIFADTMFGEVKGSKFLEKIGFQDLYQGISIAKTKGGKIIDNYLAKFKKTKPNGQRFKTPFNTYERAIYASLSRSIMGTDAEMKNEFDTELSIIKESAKKLLESNEPHLVRKGKAYAEVLEKLGLNKDNPTSETLKSNVDPINMEAADWWINEWKQHYSDLSDISLAVYNIILGQDNNYTPRRASKIDQASKESDLGEENGSAFATSLNLEESKAGVLKETNKQPLSENKYRDLDFDSNMQRSLEEALIDIYTAEAIRTIRGTFESKYFKEIIPQNDVRQRFVDKIDRYVKIKKGKGLIQDEDARKLERTLAVFSKYSTSRTLGTIMALPAQAIPTLASTFVKTRRFDFKDSFSPDAIQWLIDNGASPSIRNTASLDSIKRINEKGLRLSSSKLDLALTKVEKYDDFWLRQFLSKGDVYAATSSWFSYYKHSLKKQGLSTDIDWKDHKINKEAFGYANYMVDKTQNPSDSDLAGNIYSSQIPIVRILRNYFSPYSGFSMNQKVRIHSDFVNSLNGDNKADSRISFGAGLVEVLSFNAVKLYTALYIYRAIAQLIIGDDEDEEEFKKIEDELKKDALKQIIQDLTSPAPVLDFATIKTSNVFIDKLVESGISEDEIKKAFDKQNESNILKGKDKLDEDKFKEDYINKKKEEYRFFVPKEEIAGGTYAGIIKSYELTKSMYDLSVDKKVAVKHPDGTYTYKDASENTGKAGALGLTLVLAHDLGFLPGDASRISRLILKKAKLSAEKPNIKKVADDFKKDLDLKELTQYQKDMIKSGASLDKMIENEYEITLYGGLNTPAKQESFKKITDVFGKNIDLKTVILDINSGIDTKKIISDLKSDILSEKDIKDIKKESSDIKKEVMKEVMIDVIKNSRK